MMKWRKPIFSFFSKHKSDNFFGEKIIFLSNLPLVAVKCARKSHWFIFTRTNHWKFNHSVFILRSHFSSIVLFSVGLLMLHVFAYSTNIFFSEEAKKTIRLMDFAVYILLTFESIDDDEQTTSLGPKTFENQTSDWTTFKRSQKHFASQISFRTIIRLIVCLVKCFLFFSYFKNPKSRHTKIFFK